MKKNAEAVLTFRDTFRARLQAVVPAAPSCTVAVWAMDESRLGLRTVRRRRLTARGTKPVGLQQQRFENFYLYGAIAPQSGDGYFLGMPKLNAAGFQRFLDEFAQARPDTLNVLLVDNSRCHRAHALVIPANVVLMFQEPYAPELNPAERVWQALKDVLGWERFPDLAALQARVVEIVRGWQADMLRSLTAYPYIMTAINALSP
jgi:transposase